MGWRGPNIKVKVYVGRGLQHRHTQCAPVKRHGHTHAHTHMQHPWTVTSLKFECEIVLMSASEAYISVSLSPEPSADNYSRPLSRPESHQSCQSTLLEPEELSPGPSQNGACQGQALCSISLLIPPFFLLYHLSTPPSQPTHMVAAEFHYRANLYFQDNQHLDTHSFPILQNGRLNGNWRFNFWNETQESFWNWLPPHFPPLSCCLGDRSATTSAPRHSLSLSWSTEYSQFLRLYGDVGEMATAKCSLKLPCSSHWLPLHTFPPCRFSLITKLPSNKQTLKTKGFILSIAPSWMLGSNLKMIYANVISLCVIQHSQLMSELLQPNYKLTRLDIIARLMCFSGTCLIARRLRWG